MTVLLLLLVSVMSLSAQSFADLKGSRAKVDAAHDQCVAQDLTMMKNAAHVDKFVRLGLLVQVRPGSTCTLHKVKHPYLRPSGKLFVDRLSWQYWGATRERLVVTSATRTLDDQPWNASSKSVHPAGMAVDFRVPANPKSRAWLEGTLLTLQARGVIIATREYNPPHYHVVILPKQYASYVARKTGKK